MPELEHQPTLSEEVPTGNVVQRRATSAVKAEFAGDVVLVHPDKERRRTGLGRDLCLNVFGGGDEFVGREELGSR
ncbi:hypothetical protein QA644_21480 (plasmid) [Rhizobium sp. CC1099]|uniref:hypothetical protein n=1 Tax=Rhizobium sp. CC1099 TaxID=3039160 RepID=UPI0024B0B12B|nr:hypothetical protein [Rhizobium sp. CC1099]WFU90847.1 hypothetical protein QA644_21480 [Rhizobium sp. CC1099]